MSVNLLTSSMDAFKQHSLQTSIDLLMQTKKKVNTILIRTAGCSQTHLNIALNLFSNDDFLFIYQTKIDEVCQQMDINNGRMPFMSYQPRL